MNTSFKRIAAYIIDIVIVSLVVFIFTNVKEINFQLKDYNKTYEKYSELYKKQEKLSKKYETAKDDYKDKKITKKELNKVKDNYKRAVKKYEKSTKLYTYKLAKYSVFSTSISIAVTLLYFGIIQFVLGGQTIGKKILKIKVIKNSDGKLNAFNFLLRSFILNSVWANLILVISVNFINKGNYYTLNYYVSNILYIVELVILIMVFMNKDARGLHDVIANTKVVDIKNKDENEYIKPKKR